MNNLRGNRSQIRGSGILLDSWKDSRISAVFPLRLDKKYVNSSRRTMAASSSGTALPQFARGRHTIFAWLLLLVHLQNIERYGVLQRPELCK
jgi:hypothetical protein